MPETKTELCTTKEHLDELLTEAMQALGIQYRPKHRVRTERAMLSVTHMIMRAWFARIGDYVMPRKQFGSEHVRMPCCVYRVITEHNYLRMHNVWHWAKP